MPKNVNCYKSTAESLDSESAKHLAKYEVEPHPSGFSTPQRTFSGQTTLPEQIAHLMEIQA